MESKLASWIDKRVEEEIGFIERTVNINSGTMNLEGVAQMAALYKVEFAKLGMETYFDSEASGSSRAGHLIARTRPKSGDKKRILLIGHLDTVFEKDSPFQRFERKGERAIGPGVVDMKGGNAVILFALRALHAAGVLHKLHVTVIFTGDEEKPAPDLDKTRSLLRRIAKESDAALGFESLVNHLDTATIARRGFRGWTLKVTGKQGHSSQVFGETYGYGAIYEAARILNEFREKLAKEPNLSFSAGRIVGGTDVESDMENAQGKAFGKRNVIPKNAEVVGDLRGLTPQQVQRAMELMKRISEKNLPQTSASLTFHEGYPPMAPTEGNRALFAELAKVNRDLGRPALQEVPPSQRGAADISFAAPYTASLGGLGLLGGGDHSPSEFLEVKSVPVATKRAAVLIYRLGIQSRRRDAK